MTSGPSTSITIPNIEIDAISLVPCSIPSTAESTSSLQQASLPVTSSFTTVAKLDVGFYAIQEKISDEYFKVQILKTPWNPPRDYKFPISTKRNLRFQLKWMERFPWLSYSEYKSGAYCRVCVVMGRSLDEGKGGHQRIGQLVTEPFCKWKNALEIFEAHAKSGYHKRNSELADNFLKVMSSQASSVIQQLSSERKRQQEENRKKLIPIGCRDGVKVSGTRVANLVIMSPDLVFSGSRLDVEGRRTCPLCGEEDSWLHILANCSASEDLRQRYLPNRFNDSNRGVLASCELLGKEEWLEATGKFLSRSYLLNMCINI
ncbi:hypothetical protein C0J52_22682 [Blattella germanica]|nr:hypothetical protein C0J52_22682 [Blattella germanica]